MGDHAPQHSIQHKLLIDNGCIPHLCPMPSGRAEEQGGKRRGACYILRNFSFGRFGDDNSAECLSGCLMLFFVNVTKVPKRLHLVGGGSRKSASNNT